MSPLVCREFIKDYLDRFPLRPMLDLKAGQTVETELDGEWRMARVVEVDGSLVHIEISDWREWMYRGSTRFRVMEAKMEMMSKKTE